MRRASTHFCTIFFLLLTLVGAGQHRKNVHLADPTIFEHENTYYLYGTLNDPAIEGNGFVVYQSQDLQNWEGPLGAREGFALAKGEAYGTQGFWAPQVIHLNGTFYLFYTANEQIAVATSSSPLGPFTHPEKKALEGAVKQIDPFVFIDTDGTKYLYHVRLQKGNRIFVARMKDDLSGIYPETLTECISAQQPWENTPDVSWPVAEGPTVFKRGDLYYMLYSANDFRNPDYAVGLATATSPMGPWTKCSQNPILHGDLIEQTGTGHGDLLQLGKDRFLYVFHTHFDQDRVHPRKTALIEMEIMDPAGSPATISILPNTFRFIEK